MNLYDSASLLVTPNGYKASKIYSAKPTDGSGDLTFTRASTAMRRNSSGIWESVANNVPRLQYPVGGGCPSWLFEPQNTNECIDSDNGFSNDGTNGSSAPSSEPTNIAGVNFRKMTATAIDGLIFSNSFDVPVRSGIMIISVLLKKGTCDVVQLIDQNSTGKQITVNLTSGTVVSSNFPLGSGITHDGNGQYWVWAIQDYTSIGYRFDLYAKQVGDFYYASTQMIYGTTLQSPILTSGSAVTRIYDRINTLIDSDLFGASGCTWFIHVKNNIATSNDGVHLFGPAISNGTQGMYLATTSSNRLRLWTQSASDIFQTTADEVKLVIVSDGTNVNVFQNGVKVTTNYSFPYIFDRFTLPAVNIPLFLALNMIIPTTITDLAAIELSTL